jgi:hypothetical protein
MTTYQNNKTIRELDHQKLGPFFIVKQVNVMVFQLKLRNSMRIHLLFHVSFLEPYHISTIPRRIHDPPTPIEVNGKHEYKMEDIWDSTNFNCQLQYLFH